MTAAKNDSFRPAVRRRVTGPVRLAASLVLAALAACASPPPQSPPATQPPNILFIMADDHAVQAVGAYGHALSRLAPTPNIDRIAAGGIVFRQSFVTNSLCGPSRAAMLTGKYGHINGFTRNGDAFDGSQPTWPRALKEAGYQTAVVGKWHINHTPKGLEFDHWQVFDDQGEYYNPTVLTAGTERIDEGYATDLVTSYALEWLEERRDPSRPFALLVHHKAPHRNWMPPLRYARRFENTKFPVPDTYFDDYAGRPAAAAQEMVVYRDMYEGHDLKMTTAVGSSELRYDRWPDHFGRMTDAQRAEWDAAYKARNDAMNAADLNVRDMALWKYQRYLQDYLATVAAVDDSVGALLDYLDANGLAADTLVVYTSDQGFFLGEHGWFDKRFMYEESLRTPLVMRLPGRIAPGSESQAMVMNIDYAPTFMALAGVGVPADVQGESLVPLFGGQVPADWRDAIYYQYFEYPGFHSVRPHYGVRSERYKLIRFYGDIEAWEFYDLERDPAETHNRADDPAYAREVLAMQAALGQLREQYRVPGERTN
ncbi:MAG TPA: sulfatase [Woeseiaceae bacterium]|nr:sulfatase [Woeseiaceae bacterium]